MGQATGVAEENEFDSAKVTLVVDPSVELSCLAVVLGSDEACCVAFQVELLPN